MKKYFFLICFTIASCISYAQVINPQIINKPWNASWICVPNETSKDYGVYLFRTDFETAAKPASFIIHVSGDNRYKLFVNGKLASLGPARGDIFHWNYETVDIAPDLVSGKNIVTAIVWNCGDMKPEAQISFRTAFILQGNTAAEEVINTNNKWKCIRDKGYSPLDPNLIYSYYVTGPGDLVNDNLRDEKWMNQDYDDGAWPNAEEIFNGLPKGVFSWSDGWMLVPSSLPQMELSSQRLGKVRKTTGVDVPVSFPSAKASFTIPSNTHATVLLDQGLLTNAYPVLQFSKGKNAGISLGYAEALYIDEHNKTDWRSQHQKGNRNDIEGKRFVGKKDSIISNGKDNQSFTSLWWRTYRYLQLEIDTKDEPLTIDDLYGIFTGYPFNLNARFDTGDSTLSRVFETGWRTARLDAMETYMDCPYYEQLQYIGDTRIQCMVSLYNSGDDRLVRNAISLLDNSRMAEGATLSRYPTANPQEIPPFSLWWIGMLHDYWMYRPDADFVKSKLAGERQVLWFFNKYQQADGSLKDVPYWNFTDWCETKGWNAGVAPIGSDGSSAALDLQLLLAYQTAAELENKLGMHEYSTQYGATANQLRQTILKKYWDASRNLFADTPDKNTFSQHVNALAILTETVTGNDATALAKKILGDTSLTEATIYFKYYIHQALIKAGFGNDYLRWLQIWRDNLAQGMTTWAEISDINNARSDCHAWGAHPNIEFIRTVLGIDSDAPGFSRIKIEPHPGDLKNLSGEMPHPNGKIKVEYHLINNQWKISIQLPDHTPGYLIWYGKRYELKEGVNNFIL